MRTRTQTQIYTQRTRRSEGVVGGWVGVWVRVIIRHMEIIKERGMLLMERFEARIHTQAQVEEEDGK